MQEVLGRATGELQALVGMQCEVWAERCGRKGVGSAPGRATGELQALVWVECVE